MSFVSLSFHWSHTNRRQCAVYWTSLCLSSESAVLVNLVKLFEQSNVLTVSVALVICLNYDLNALETRFCSTRSPV